MANVARNLLLGIAAGVTTRIVRKAARNAMHDELGVPRIPRQARTKAGFDTMLLWAAGVGVALALVDILKEQMEDSAGRR